MIFEFDECVLDTTKQELWRDGQVEHVEPQVLAVIEYLAINDDRVVSKIELLDEVWGDRFVSESALTSRIKLARRACGDSGRAQRIIKTVHSRGYRMVAPVTRRDTGTRREADVETEVATVASGPAAARRGVSTAVFGREDEISALDAALEAAASGERKVVFVCGGLGSGKSTLVAEFLERHDHLEDWNVARGQCLETRGVTEPYFCLLDAISNLAHENEDTVRATLLRSAPSWLNQLPSLVDEDTAELLERRLLGSADTRMLREGADAFALLAARRPLLLILEDLHLADDCTLDVLELLLRRGDASPLLIIGTARPDHVELGSVVGPAVARGDAVELHLSPLGDEAIAALICDRSGASDAPEDLVSLVARRSEGIPLFAEEIVTAWTRESLIEVVGGSLSLVGEVADVERTIPATLPPLIERELGALDVDELSVLHVCAAAGDTFDAAAVAAATGASIVDTEQLLATIERRHGLIGALGASSWPDGTISATYGFSNALFREVIHDRVPASERADIHLRIARVLEAAWADRADELATALAAHYLEAGDALRAVEHLRRAGERASTRSAHRHAVELFNEALSRLEALPESTERDRAECLLRASLGPALVATNGWFDPEVSDNYERVLLLSADSPDGPEAAAARYGLATVSELHGTFDLTEDLLTPLLVPRDEGPLTLEAHELVACSNFHQGAFARSLRNAEMVLDSWDEETYSVPMARIAEHPASSCSSWSSLALWALGRSDDSLAQAERAVSVAERNLYALSTAVQQRAMFHQLRAELDECIRWSERCREIGEDQAFPMRIVQADIYKGWALGVSGAAGEGLAMISDGIERFRAADVTLNEPYYLGLYANVVLETGDPERAAVLVQEALGGLTSRSYFYESEIHRIGAAAELAEGNISVAREWLQRSSAVARQFESPALELRSLIDRVVLEQAHGDPAEALSDLAALAVIYDGQAPTPDAIRARELLSR